MTQPARASVNEHGYLATPQTESLGERVVEDFIDLLQLDEVIPRAECSELTAPAILRALRHGARVGAGKESAGFGVCEVRVDAILHLPNDRRCAFSEDAVELLVVEVISAAATGAGWDAT
jgi:hypothetical protein